VVKRKTEEIQNKYNGKEGGVVGILLQKNWAKRVAEESGKQRNKRGGSMSPLVEKENFH